MSADRLPLRLAASTLGVLLTARLLVVIALGATTSVWTPVALMWQDIGVAATAGLLTAALRSHRIAWVLYAALVGYAAINVPATIVLGSPLTPTMLAAAGGALSDSVVHHLTTANVLRLLLVVGAGVLFPPLSIAVVGPRRPAAWAVALVSIAMFGPIAASRSETAGLDRNAITALTASAWRDRVSADAPDESSARAWRTSPAGATTTGAEPDLSAYRGAARGFNVVLVVLESTAAAYLRPYGATDDPMPALTRLSQQALVFDAAYAVYPESVKGLYATLCGRLPIFGVQASAHATLPCASVARSFSDAGYQTGLFHSGRFRYLGMDALVEQQGYQVAEDAGAIGGQVESSFGVDESATVSRMLGWIDAQPAHAPFLLTYLPIAGHHPYAASRRDPFTGDSEFDRYRNALGDADRALDALLAGLRVRALDSHTLIVVVGDHGEAFGQHRGNSGHTLFIYDENVRVPYFIWLAGRLTAPLHVPRAASLVDTGATLRDLTGLPPDDRDEGTSLVAPGSRMALFFADYSLGWMGLRDGCWKYLYETEARRSHLHDVCSDTGERQNLASREPVRAALYEARVQSWLDAGQR
ncbi:MAG: sulfatase-like hydrolase/transferase [Vicinamibacterales bacterium]